MADEICIGALKREFGWVGAQDPYHSWTQSLNIRKGWKLLHINGIGPADCASSALQGPFAFDSIGNGSSSKGHAAGEKLSRTGPGWSVGVMKTSRLGNGSDADVSVLSNIAREHIIKGEVGLRRREVFPGVGKVEAGDVIVKVK